MNNTTECVTDYIQFYVDNVIPQKEIRNEVKDCIICVEKKAFKKRERMQLKNVQKELNCVLRIARKRHKEITEQLFFNELQKTVGQY